MDIDRDSLHHTLGLGPQQAAPGNHLIHTGAVKEVSVKATTLVNATEVAVGGLDSLVIDVPDTVSGSMRYDIYVILNWASSSNVMADFILRDGGVNAPTNTSTELERQPGGTGTSGSGTPQSMVFTVSTVLTSGRHTIGLFVLRTFGTSVIIAASTVYNSRLRATPIGFN